MFNVHELHIYPYVHANKQGSGTEAQQTYIPYIDKHKIIVFPCKISDNLMPAGYIHKYKTNKVQETFFLFFTV